MDFLPGEDGLKGAGLDTAQAAFAFFGLVDAGMPVEK
jgi:hypothetical protein